MEWYQYPHLKIIEDVDDEHVRRMGLQFLIVGKVAGFAAASVSEVSIQAEIRNMFGFCIPLDKISRNGSDYLIHVSSSTEYVLVLTRGYFHSLKLTVMPWNREYGSSVVPLESQLRDLESVNLESIAWQLQNGGRSLSDSEDVVVEIWGIPAHLCIERTVHDLLGDFCDIIHVSFVRFMGFAVVRISNPGGIRSHANIGIKKNVGGQFVVNVWPVWYKIAPVFVAGN